MVFFIGRVPHRRRQSVIGKLTREVKTPINNLIRAKIKIDRGRSGLTWFETGAYAKTTLMKLDVNHMQQ